MDNLKLLRLEKGLSQKKLAEQIHTSQQNIQRYEVGRYQPDFHTLKLLADYFETSIDYLLGHTEIRHKIEPVQPFELNSDESLLIEKYRKLNRNEKNSIVTMIDTLLLHH